MKMKISAKMMAQFKNSKPSVCSEILAHHASNAYDNYLIVRPLVINVLLSWSTR